MSGCVVLAATAHFEVAFIGVNGLGEADCCSVNNISNNNDLAELRRAV